MKKRQKTISTLIGGGLRGRRGKIRDAVYLIGIVGLSIITALHAKGVVSAGWGVFTMVTVPSLIIASNMGLKAFYKVVKRKNKNIPKREIETIYKAFRRNKKIRKFLDSRNKSFRQISVTRKGIR